MYLPASGQAVPPVSRLLFVPTGRAEQEREAENEHFPFSHAVQYAAFPIPSLPDPLSMLLPEKLPEPEPEPATLPLLMPLPDMLPIPSLPDPLSMPLPEKLPEPEPEPEPETLPLLITCNVT